MHIVVNRSTLAHLLCLSDARTAQLVVSGVLPRPVKRGSYDVINSTRAYITHLKTATRGGLAAERERLTKAKADRAELDLRTRQGELVEVRALQRQAFQAGRLVRDNMLQISDRLAGVLASPEHPQTQVHALMTKEIRQALETLSTTQQL